MKLVLVESPFAGDVEKNLAFARACLHDCFIRGEAPFASHASQFTQKRSGLFANPPRGVTPVNAQIVFSACHSPGPSQ